MEISHYVEQGVSSTGFSGSQQVRLVVAMTGHRVGGGLLEPIPPDERDDSAEGDTLWDFVLPAS